MYPRVVWLTGGCSSELRSLGLDGVFRVFVVRPLLLSAGWNRLLIFGPAAGPVLVNLGITAVQRHSAFWLLTGWLVPFVLGGALAEIIPL